MAGSPQSSSFMPPRSIARASALGAFSGWPRNAGARASPTSISATGSPTARKWLTRRASRRWSASLTAAGRRSRRPTSKTGRRQRSKPGRNRFFAVFGSMTLGMLSSTLFGDMFGTAAMRAVFDDIAFLVRCAEVEAALARAQARVGIVPPEAAAAISIAAEAVKAAPGALHLVRLQRETETVGYPI